MAENLPVALAQELLDREAIRDLPIRYCHYVWIDDVQALVAMFTRDGVMDSGRGQAKGHERLLEFYTVAMKQLEPRPLVHNHVIELLGPDRARGWCYSEIRSGKQAFETVLITAYEDEYAKEDGVWKFKLRKGSTTELKPAPFDHPR